MPAVLNVDSPRSLDSEQSSDVEHRRSPVANGHRFISLDIGDSVLDSHDEALSHAESNGSLAAEPIAPERRDRLDSDPHTQTHGAVSVEESPIEPNGISYSAADDDSASRAVTASAADGSSIEMTAEIDENK